MRIISFNFYRTYKDDEKKNISSEDEQFCKQTVTRKMKPGSYEN